VIGGSEKGKKGRSKGLKKINRASCWNCRSWCWSSLCRSNWTFFGNRIRSFLKKYVSKDAEVISDKCKRIYTLKKGF
jgi:hypothetical protein